MEKLRTASYPPLSDGYLDWIPAKRRRVVSKTKRVSLLLLESFVGQQMSLENSLDSLSFMRQSHSIS